ncbi:hypothetical protein CFN78_21215 [Amycolatopsis antarctica]|uniref:Uncharacterized protein n=1 Tax=Amycolatopsis antarctica TaxID=1854586 RepID=A0A263CYX4_9PSEU|nr:hypothetical protein [Amycolatopsis antarctica]OZM71311.1 hypothetical protein CFN78_21215 [Amycolatopsis antarctica]
MSTTNAITRRAESVDVPFGRLQDFYEQSAAYTPALAVTGIGDVALAAIGGAAIESMVPEGVAGEHASVRELVSLRTTAVRA